MKAVKGLFSFVTKTPCYTGGSKELKRCKEKPPLIK